MKFSLLLKELSLLKLDPSQFAITSSGPMAVRNLREASDLDLITSPSLWEKLAKEYPVIPGPPCDKIQIGNIEILGESSVFQNNDIATFEQQLKTADTIDGLKYVNLELIKRFKQKMGREKDLKDIELIDKYLAFKNT